MSPSTGVSLMGLFDSLIHCTVHFLGCPWRWIRESGQVRAVQALKQSPFVYVHLFIPTLYYTVNSEE